MQSYFKAAEFACHDGTPYPIEWRADRLVRLCAPLNRGRARYGHAVRVVSGFRTWAWNTKIGGAPHSQHPEGLAADVAPIVDDGADFGRAVSEFHDMLIEMLLAGFLPEVGGLGYYPEKWVHLDVRPRPPSGHVAMWQGAGIGSEAA